MFNYSINYTTLRVIMDIYKTEEFKDFYFKTSEYKPLKSITCLRGFYCFCFNLVL